MKKIKLPNRDGADLWMESTGEQVAENIGVWKLNVDSKHKYCLEYIRVIGNLPDDIQAVDPAGGPFIPVDSVLKSEDNKYYEIVKIVDSTTFWLGERNNYNKEHP